MGEMETEGHGHHQSVICRARYDQSPSVVDPSRGLYDSEATADDVCRQPTVTSTIHDHQRRLKTDNQTAPGVYSSRYCDSTATDDNDEVEEDSYPTAVALRPQQQQLTGVRQYIRSGCSAAGHRLQHHAPTGNHVTGYTSVIVETHQLHANGYVH